MKAAPIQWENGVFLAPQVFQQEERYLEAQFRFLRRANRGLSFGVLDVGLDPAALAQNKLKLVVCQAVLPAPDGAVIDVPLVDSPPPERDFSIPTGAQTLEVFLTLPVQSAAGRTQGREQTVTDTYDANRQRPVKIAEKALALAVSGDPLNNLTVLKVAEIERHAQTGKPVLRGSFIPSCLAISAAPGLLQLVRGVLTRAEGMLKELPAARRQRRFEDFAFLQILQQQVPAIRHLVEDAAEGTHPSWLYENLLHLAGGLQGFADMPLTWPRYDHARLDRCFPQLCQVIDGLLGCKPASDDVKIVLKRKNRESSFWRERLEPLPSPESQVLLALRGDLPTGKLIAGLEGSGKIAAGSKIMMASMESAFAVPFRHETRLPERILAEPGIYYVIDTKHELFAEVRKSGEIGVYIPADLLGDKEPTIEIIYVGGGGRP